MFIITWSVCPWIFACVVWTDFWLDDIQTKYRMPRSSGCCELYCLYLQLYIFLFLTMAMQFQQIIALLSHTEVSVCSMSWAGKATTSEKLKTLNIPVIFFANFSSMWSGYHFSAQWQHSNLWNLHCSCHRKLFPVHVALVFQAMINWCFCPWNYLQKLTSIHVVSKNNINTFAHTQYLESINERWF